MRSPGPVRIAPSIVAVYETRVLKVLGITPLKVAEE
jgi:hypothetical protein